MWGKPLHVAYASIESLEQRALASADCPPTAGFRAPESAGLFLGAPGPEIIGVPQPLYPQAEMARRGSLAFYDPPVTGAPSWQFGLVFSGSDGVDPATTVGADLVTLESGGKTLNVTYLGQAGDATRSTSYFRADAPGGTWDAADNGDYAVRLKGDRVASVGGHLSPAQTVQTFEISVPERGPDLAATWSTRSSPAAMALRNGRAATVHVSVTNVGTLPMAYPASVSIKLARADAATAAGAVDGATDFFDPEPFVVGGTTVKRLDLQPGQSKLVKVRVRAPQGLADGVYRYQPSVFTSAVVELGDHNNVDPSGPLVTLVQGTATPVPDATMLTLSSTVPPSASRGSYMSVTVTVQHASGVPGRYTGEAHVGSGPRVKFGGKLAAGEARVHSLRVYVPPDTRNGFYGDVLAAVNMKSFSLPKDPSPRSYSDGRNVVVRG